MWVGLIQSVSGLKKRLKLPEKREICLQMAFRLKTATLRLPRVSSPPAHPADFRPFSIIV